MSELSIDRDKFAAIMGAIVCINSDLSYTIEGIQEMQTCLDSILEELNKGIIASS